MEFFQCDLMYLLTKKENKMKNLKHIFEIISLTLTVVGAIDFTLAFKIWAETIIIKYSTVISPYILF